MIQARIPELTIKFNEKPELPAEGKKVTVEIQGENNVTVKAELNRKTLKKRTARALGFRARKDGASSRSPRWMSLRIGLLLCQEKSRAFPQKE